MTRARYLTIAQAKQVLERFPAAVLTAADGYYWFDRKLAADAGVPWHHVSRAAWNHLRVKGVITFSHAQSGAGFWVKAAQKEVSKVVVPDINLNVTDLTAEAAQELLGGAEPEGRLAGRREPDQDQEPTP